MRAINGYLCTEYFQFHLFLSYHLAIASDFHFLNCSDIALSKYAFINVGFRFCSNLGNEPSLALVLRWELCNAAM